MQIVDDGEFIKTNAEELLGLKPLSTVVVTGKAKRNDAGDLTVQATHVYVKKL